MNNERRKQIAVANALIERAHSILEHTRECEEEAHDNMPESMQYASEKSEVMLEAISALEDVVADLDNAKDILENGDGLMTGNVTDKDLIAAVRS